MHFHFCQCCGQGKGAQLHFFKRECAAPRRPPHRPRWHRVHPGGGVQGLRRHHGRHIQHGRRPQGDRRIRILRRRRLRRGDHPRLRHQHRKLRLLKLRRARAGRLRHHRRTQPAGIHRPSEQPPPFSFFFSPS